MKLRPAAGAKFGWLLPAALAVAACLSGCASGGGDTQVNQSTTQPAGGRETSGRAGTTVVDLQFMYAFENEATEPYYPIEGLAGCRFSLDGTLIVCDEMKGKVFGLDPSTRRWFEFDAPIARPYRPVDLQIDGFKVLVLDTGGNYIHRFDLSGSYQDRLLEINQIDPGEYNQGTAFDIDRDGRFVISDSAQQQALLLDAFLNLQMRLGGPGNMDDQFSDPAGVAFRPDGSYLISDRGNRRLALYGRLGFFESVVGGDFDVNNPFVAPQGLDCDRFGNVFVADLGAALIHVLDSRLRLRFSAGRDFSLKATPLGPVGVAVSQDGLLAVTDRARSAILVYRIIYE